MDYDEVPEYSDCVTEVANGNFDIEEDSSGDDQCNRIAWLLYGFVGEIQSKVANLLSSCVSKIVR